MATITANTGTNNWNTNAAWVGSVQPSAADDVVLPSGAVLTIGNGVTALARSLTVQSGATLNWANTLTARLDLGDATAGAGNVAISVSSGATISANGGVSTINFNSTSATQQTITTGGKSMPSLNFLGAGSSYVLGDALTAGTITLNAGTFNTANYSMAYTTFSAGTGSARTLTLGSSTCTASILAMSFANLTNFTMTANTAVITSTYAPTSTNNVFVLNSFNWQGLSFVLNGGGVAALNIAGATIGSLTINGTASQVNSYRVSGSFTCTAFNVTGNSTLNRPLIYSITNGTAVTITAASTSLTNVDFMDITGAGAGSWGITGGRIGDWQGNSGITFTTPATQTRDSTSGANWGVDARWTSRVPLPQDDVIVNASSGTIANTDTFVLGKNVNFTGYTGTLTHSSQGTPFAVFGDLILGAGMSFNSARNTFYMDFRGRGTHVITSNGQTFFPFTSNQIINVAAPNGSYSLTDAFTMTAALNAGNCTFAVLAGTFNTNNNTMTIGRFVSSGTITRSVQLGTSTINLQLTGTSTFIANTATGLTIDALNATFNVLLATANTRTLDLGGTWIGTFNHTVAGSTGRFDITTAGFVTNFNFSDATNARVIQITAGVTFVPFNFNVFGGAGRLVTIKSSTTGLAHLSKPFGGTLYNATQNYIAYEYIQATQPQSLWLGANSTQSNCLGILASAPTYRHAQSTAATTVASGTSITATYATATTAGNLLIAYFTSSLSQGTYTPPAGWTLAKQSTASVEVYIYFKIANGTETSVTFSQTTSRTLNASLVEYSGFTGTPTLDVTDSNTYGLATTTLSTSAIGGVTNTAQPALAVAMLANPSTLAATTSLTNGFSEDRTLTNASSAYKGAVKELTTLAAVETTFSWTTGRSNTAVALVVFTNVGGVVSNSNFLMFM